MGRYYGSEALRNHNLPKKTFDYAIDKLSTMVRNVGSLAIDQLSKKIRPNLIELDGSGIYTYNKNIYYINTNEIPGELSREKLIIFTCENITVAMLHNKSPLSHQTNY